MECSKDFFDSWLKTQEKIIENLAKMTATTHEDHSLSEEKESDPGTNNSYTRNRVLLTEMLESVKKTSIENYKVVDESLTKTLHGTTVYAKLYRFWKPLLKTTQENTENVDVLTGLADPSEYKEILDKVFGFPAGQMTDMYEQYGKCLEGVCPPVDDFIKPWIDTSKTYFNSFPSFTVTDPENGQDILHNLLSVYMNAFGKFFPVPTMGSAPKKNGQLLKGMDCLNRYLLQASKYQHMIYITGQNAIEKIISDVADKINAGEEPGTFDEFFDLWIKVNEKCYQNLFRTDEFSNVQNDMLVSSLELKKYISRQMERNLAEFPIPVRSEMNDLYKIIYELRKKVKSLEKKVNEAGK